MDKKSWDSLSKPERAKLLKSAGLPTGLAQLNWSGLQKSERKKLEKGKGWHEKATEVSTHEGIRKIAKRHHEVALEKEASEANNKPMQKPAHEEQAQEKEIPNGYKLATKDYQRERYEREFIKGGVNIVIAMQYHTTRHYWHVNVYFTYEPHFRTEVVDGLEYTKSRKEARDFAYNAMRKNPEEYYNNLSDYYKNLIAESLKKSIQKEESVRKEPPLISDPKWKSYDMQYEKTEDERMQEEGKREEETYEDTVLPFDTGNLKEMKEDLAATEAYRMKSGGVFTEAKQKEWEAHEAGGYKAEEEVEEASKPKGKPASEALITLYPEEHYFGTEVTVVTEEGIFDYNGKIMRLLNGGTLAEVRPSGDDFIGSSFRVPVERVYVNKVVETKEPSKTEPKTSPKIAISKTDSHSVYLVGDIKDRSFVALANIIVTEDGRVLELPGMDYMKGRDDPSENFNFTTVKEYLEDLKAKKEEVKRKQQEEKEAYERKEAEIKERLSKPPSGYFIHKQDENGDPNLEPVTGKVYPFEHQGIDLFAFRDMEWGKRVYWNVSERRTGLFVSGGRTKAEAIQKAKEHIDKKGAGEVKRQIKVALGKMGR